MSKRPEVAVCILAGGASRRFGNHKACAERDGKPLLAHVIDRILAQTNGPMFIIAFNSAVIRTGGTCIGAYSRLSARPANIGMF